MLSISIPLWILCSAVGLPTLMLFLIIFKLIRQKKLNKKRSAETQRYPVPVQSRVFNEEVHQQLLDQQIDAVFNALATLIETERIKLKALMNRHLTLADFSMPSSVKRSEYNPSNTKDEAEVDTPSRQTSLPIGKTIAAMFEDGHRLEDIARRLGVSQSEVNLAIKMNRTADDSVGSKMTAVA